MAEVLTVSTADQGFGSPLRRTSSQPTLLLDTQTQAHATINKSDYKAAYRLGETSRSSASAPSSAPSSPRTSHIDFSNHTSSLSTPSSSLSLDAYEEEDYEDDHDGDAEYSFPAYGSFVPKPSTPTDRQLDPMDLTPRGSPRRKSSDDDVAALNPDPPASLLSRSDSMNLTNIVDDHAAKPQPTRHVDYLSHDWNEEDIWSSWRHIVEKRGCLDNWERLENASWRTWTKSQKNLKTINPDRLNWMKDHDVTWLYGPLQTGSVHIQDSTLRSALSRNDSFVGKKPILKKRSISEVMLQRSISSQSLMRQATDSIRAQEAAYRATRPKTGNRGFSDFCPQPSPANSNDDTVLETPSPMASYASSESDSVPDEGRHIHFNETVEQCIAISSDSDEPMLDETVFESEDEHSSDEEFLTMKTDRHIERKLSRNSTPRNSFSDGCISGKTIAMLPATKLKYRDTPELAPQQDLSKELTDRLNSGLRASSSQETLRPDRPYANFLLDDDEDYGLDPEWTSSGIKEAAQPKQPSGGLQVRFGDGSIPGNPQPNADVYRDANDELQHRNMRRTPSGMFMPYEEGDEKIAGEGEGLYGRVVDSYNTARDIAHVIWNVGWRR